MIRIAKMAHAANMLDRLGFYDEADALTRIMERCANDIYTEQSDLEVPEGDKIKPYSLKFIHPGSEIKPESNLYRQFEDPSQYKVIDPRNRDYMDTLERSYRDRPYGNPDKPNAYEWVKNNLLPRYYHEGNVGGELLPEEKLPKPQYFGNYVMQMPPGFSQAKQEDRARLVAHDEDLSQHEQNIRDILDRSTRRDPNSGIGQYSSQFNVTSFGSEGKIPSPVHAVYDSALDKAGIYEDYRKRGSIPFSSASDYEALRTHNPEGLSDRARAIYDSIDWDNPDPELVQKLYKYTSRGYSPQGIVNIERRMRQPSGEKNQYINRKELRSHFPNLS